jgi:carbonic anhydrase
MADQDDDILDRMMENNRSWAEKVNQDNPGFFDRLAKQQTPRVLWIGCSDSRVPGNESIGVMPGEVFFHRNIANQIQMVDFNGLSVLQYAVEWLRVRHIVVCGHYGCGGVKTALKQNELGLLNNWLYGVGELSRQHHERLNALPDRNARIDALCELNAIEQVRNVCRSPILLQAWRRGQDVAVHAWMYDLTNGRLKNLEATVDGEGAVEAIIGAALARPPLGLRSAG